MFTDMIKVFKDQINDNNPDIIRAGNIIKDGGLVAFPTETVYGLGGDALNPLSSAKIYAAKGRPSDNPLIVHIDNLDELPLIVTDIPDVALKLANAFWPGPLTMIFNKSDKVPYETTGGLNTVAVRMPGDPIALSFIKASGGYIAAPSANLSGRPSPTSAKHVYEDLNGKIELIIDGGDCDIGLESTIVDLTCDIPMILRPGFISQDMLKKVCGDVTIDPAIKGPLNENIRPKAPGMKYRHYAPKGSLSIVSGEASRVTEYILEAAKKERSQGKRVGVIALSDNLDKYKDVQFLKDAGNVSDEISISSRLYSILRDCDEAEIDVIFSEEFNTPLLGPAIMNRLLKAAGHTVINV